MADAASHVILGFDSWCPGFTTQNSALHEEKHGVTCIVSGETVVDGVDLRHELFVHPATPQNI